MRRRRKIAPKRIADVIVASRRRCCVCFGLNSDARRKRGQIAHLDRQAANDKPDNLAFLCLAHHDEYDSRTSQSKGLTMEEVKRYRGQLDAFIAEALPPSDSTIAAALVTALDRPAFRTHFQQESSLPRFRSAIAEAIETLNTGKTPQGARLPAKSRVSDPAVRSKLDSLVEKLVALRATFDDLLRTKDVRPCGCSDPDCPVYMLSDRAAREMDRRRRDLLALAHELAPSVSPHFYDVR